MNRAPKPIPADVADLLHYDAETGVLTWRVSLNARGPAGAEAGTIDTTGYRRVRIRGQRFKAHRLAWAIAYGDPGEQQIDHANGQRLDNRLANLRLATSEDNARNTVNALNTSGHRGVSWDKPSSRWRARIWDGPKRKWLGSFDRIEDAAAAYQAASDELHGPFAVHRRDRAA